MTRPLVPDPGKGMITEFVEDRCAWHWPSVSNSGKVGYFMELYVGGCGQDKLKAVMEDRKEEKSRMEVFYGEDILSNRIFCCQVIDHFHLIIKKLPQSDIPLFLEELYEKNPNVIIICDEVGNGIVPVSGEERLYREQVGKSCQWLAARSRRVVRVVCGCMQVLKEE